MTPPEWKLPLFLTLPLIISRGRDLSGGKVFDPKSANFDSFYSKLCKFLQVFPKFAQISTIFSKIWANFDNFYQKRGKLFQKFSACGENILFLAE